MTPEMSKSLTTAMDDAKQLNFTRDSTLRAMRGHQIGMLDLELRA